MANTLGMSSQMYFDEKDHVDIVYKNKYHNAIISGSFPLHSTNGFNSVGWEKYPRDICSNFDIGLNSNSGIFLYNSNLSNFDFLYSPLINPYTNYMSLSSGCINPMGEYYYWVNNFDNSIHEHLITNDIIDDINNWDIGRFEGNDNTYELMTRKTNSHTYRRLDTSTNTTALYTWDYPADYDVSDDFTYGSYDKTLFVVDSKQMAISANYRGILGYNRFYSGGTGTLLRIASADYIQQTRKWIIQANTTGRLVNSGTLYNGTPSTRTFIFICDDDISNAVNVLNSEDINRIFIWDIRYVQGYYYFRKRANSDAPYKNGSWWKTKDFNTVTPVDYDYNYYSSFYKTLSMPTVTIDEDGGIEISESTNYDVEIGAKIEYSEQVTFFQSNHSNTNGWFEPLNSNGNEFIYLHNGYTDSPNNRRFIFCDIRNIRLY